MTTPHENSNQRSMTSDERKALDEFTMHELKPHENDGKSLGELARRWAALAALDLDEIAEKVAAEVRRRDGERVKILEGELEESLESEQKFKRLSSDINRDLQKSQYKVRELEAELQKTMAENLDLLNEIGELNNQLADNDTRVRELERKLAAWENQAKASQRKVAELQVELEKHKQGSREFYKSQERDAQCIRELKAEVERLKGEVAKILEQRETISEARDHVARELWKAKEKFSADWEAREKEVDAMRDSVRRQGEIVVLLQRENEDLKRAEKERPERQLEAFTKAAMQGLCAPVFAAMPNGDWPSISLDVEDEIARTAKSIAEKTLAELRKEQEPPEDKDYIEQLPCSKCGQQHWMHGDCNEGGAK